jgi:hypothetical protein
MHLPIQQFCIQGIEIGSHGSRHHEVAAAVANHAFNIALSIEVAYKLDDVRAALQHGHICTAGKFGRVYTLMPLSALKSFHLI